MKTTVFCIVLTALVLTAGCNIFQRHAKIRIVNGYDSAVNEITTNSYSVSGFSNISVTSFIYDINGTQFDIQDLDAYGATAYQKVDVSHDEITIIYQLKIAASGTNIVEDPSTNRLHRTIRTGKYQIMWDFPEILEPAELKPAGLY